MNVALSPSSSVALLLSSLVACFSIARPAHADEAPVRRAERVLESMLSGSESAARGVESLPARLSLWSAVEDEIELREAHSFSRNAFHPQGRLTQQTPFIDFSHFEMGGYVGIVGFSSDFEADPAMVAGITARVPVPGIPLGDWGVFAQLFISYISRDLPFYYTDTSGNWIGAELGGDYTFVKDEIWYLRGQAGILYANWNDINALDNGVGILVGIQAGFYWIKHNRNAVVTITPQLTYDGSNWMGFFTVGFSYDF